MWIVGTAFQAQGTASLEALKQKVDRLFMNRKKGRVWLQSVARGQRRQQQGWGL